jgi:putative tryptophan/tyrosine transport system substrate-binding protein
VATSSPTRRLAGAAAWPLVARAQQPPAMPVIGWLDGGQGQPNPAGETAFRKGLSEMGYVEGRNVAIEYRGRGHPEQLPAAAAELVRQRVAVIFATETANSALAARAATPTIPIVFINGADPVKLGLIASYSRPGGNATGVSYYSAELVSKRLELLLKLVQQAAVIGFLINPNNRISERDKADIEAAARTVGQPIMVLQATTSEEIDTAFATFAAAQVSALLVDGDGLLFNRRAAQFAVLTARYRLPASYPTRVYADAGGLMSYGDHRSESWREAGVYVGRVLKGEKPADLPVVQPTKFEFVINLRTAKALGLTIPETLLATADEVIE